MSQLDEMGCRLVREVRICRNKSLLPATEALKSPTTRRLVHEVLALAETRDIVDAIHDLEHAVAYLREQL